MGCGDRVFSTLAGMCLVTALSSGTAEARDCLQTAQDLRAVLALPAAQKEGRVFCLAPGRYDGLTTQDFMGAFTGIDPARPVTFEAEDPADPPVLNLWTFVVAPADRTARAESGDVILRDLVFDVSDEPLMPLGQDGFRGQRNAVQMGLGGRTRNVLVERITVRGGLEEARLGTARETERGTNGVIGREVHNVTVRDSRFERILNAITLGGTDITIEGNRMRHGWGDLVRVIPQVLQDGCRDTDGVVIRNNMMYDLWSNHRQHPDVVHMFADSRVPCSIRNVLIEGNIAFPGEFGLRQPAHPTSLLGSPPTPPPSVLDPVARRLYRVVGPGQTQLPPVSCADGPVWIGLQFDPASTGPVRLLAPPDGMTVMNEPAASLDLDAPWETWRIFCRPNKPDLWQVVRQMPGFQGVFTNPLPDDAGFHGVVIRHNILWVPEIRAVGFRDPDNRDITITNNSFLRPWPGDADGDGVPNTFDDGFRAHLPGSRILIDGGERIRVTGNVATGGHGDGDAARINDLGLTHTDGGRSVMARFAMKPDGRFMPFTPTEAVSMARPKPGGILDGRGTGAVATDPADDPYDWSWVRDDWDPARY